MKEYAANIRSSELSLVDVPATPGDAAAGADSSADAESICASAAASADKFLAKAAKERASGLVDQSLWGRAVAEAGGDKARATRIYLDSRATALRVAKRHIKAARRARVVEVLSNAPDTGFTVEPSEARDQATSKKTYQTRRGSAKPYRRHVILAAGVLGSVLVIVGLVALRSESPAQQYSVANAAPPVSVSGRSIPSGKTASVAAKTGGPVREDVSGEDFVGKVQALEKAGNWNLLVIHAAEWTRKQPGNPAAWKQLSQGYVKQRQFSEALDAATKAVQLAPDDFAMWQNLGLLNATLQRLPEALQAFQRAVALNDRDVVSLGQEGILNTQLGHVPDARIAFAKALAVSPEDVPALCGAASLAQKEGRAKDAEAMTRQVTSLGGGCRDSSGNEFVRVVASGSAQSRPASALGR